MGNGSRLDVDDVLFDIETSDLQGGAVLTQDILEQAAKQVMANFGKPTIIMLPPNFGKSFPYIGMPQFEMFPEYHGTPWASSSKLTKREKRVASLHTILKKLDVLRNIDEEAFAAIKYKSTKRLKRAKWAQYQQKKA